MDITADRRQFLAATVALVVTPLQSYGSPFPNRDDRTGPMQAFTNGIDTVVARTWVEAWEYLIEHQWGEDVWSRIIDENEEGRREFRDLVLTSVEGTPEGFHVLAPDIELTILDMDGDYGPPGHADTKPVSEWVKGFKEPALLCSTEY